MSEREQQSLGGLSSAITIARGVPTIRTRPKGDVPVHSVASLFDGGEPNAYVDMDDIADVRALVAEPGDVILGIEGARLGESFSVVEGLPTFVPSQQAVTIRVADPSLLHPGYVAAWAASPQTRQQVQRLARGTTIQRIAVADIATLVIPSRLSKCRQTSASA
jgi:hypothetical protein